MKGNHEMGVREERERRWMAYYLEEADPSDRAAIEEELRLDPEEAERVRLVCDGVRSWAQQEVAPSHLSLEDLPIGGLASRTVALKQRRALLWRTLPWAAAATFILALSQANFSVQVGDSTFSWGEANVTPYPEEGETVIALQARIAELEKATTEAQDLVQQVALQSVELETEFRETATELAENQRLESQIRYRDMERLLSLYGAGSEYPAATFSGMTVP